MAFKLINIIAEGRIADLDRETQILSIFGVDQRTGCLGLAKRADLTKIGLFDFFEKQNQKIEYLRLLEFLYLPEEDQYVAVIQYLPLKRKPAIFNSSIAEEYVISQHLVERAPEDHPEDQMRKQHIGLIKFSPELEITQKSALAFSPNERITTSIDGNLMTILRAKIKDPANLSSLKFDEFILEFVSLKTLQKDDNLRQRRRFSYETPLSVSRFIYKEPGIILMVLSYFRSICRKSDSDNQNKTELRMDRVTLLRRSEGLLDFIQDDDHTLLLTLEHHGQEEDKQKRLEAKKKEKEDRAGTKGGEESAQKPPIRKKKSSHGKRPRSRANKGLLERLSPDEKAKIKEFSQLIKGAKVLRYEFLGQDYSQRKPLENRRLGVPRGSSQCPAGYFSFLNPDDQAQPKDLKLTVWSNQLKGFKSKNYPHYFKRLSPAAKKYKNCEVKISSLHPIDQDRLALLEYYATAEGNIYRNRSDVAHNQKFEFGREDKFGLSYLDIRSQKVNRFWLEAPNLILNRLLIWQRSCQGDSDGLVVADFDEEMNLVLFDLSTLTQTKSAK